MLIIIQSSCSLFGFYKTRRYIGYNSICWEDNEHIIIYSSIEQYHDVMDMGGGDIVRDWVGGELWRINANTGEKELLFREKELEYWARDPKEIRIDVVNSHIYISGSRNTYKVKEDYSEWEIEIDSVICPVVSEDERYIVGTRVGGDVVKYDIINRTVEVICEEPGGTVSDYDYSRNYLLVNNNKFIDLNTGEDKEIEPRDTIEEHCIISYSLTVGKIEEEYITMDAVVWDLNKDYEDVIGKIRVKINNFEQKEFYKNIQGILNPDGTKYATLGLFTDTLGDTISTWSLPSDEL